MLGMPRLLINLDVPDLQAAEVFYTSAFELHVGRRFPQGVVELLGAEAPIYLLHKPSTQAWSAHANASGTRDYQRHWTPVHLDFVVDDLDSALARARAAGAIIESEAREYNWGRIALLADPYGHGLCLLQFLGRGYDELLGAV
jgi:catechol 2,3-dioxygenase-like lactoylglutathione lyase family enzyme